MNKLTLSFDSWNGQRGRLHQTRIASSFIPFSQFHLRLLTDALLCCLPLVVGPSNADSTFQGFGASTAGGDHGAVVHVTTLADSGRGSLREALSRENCRIIFRVGGVIRLRSPLLLKNSKITVDGSGAPPPGVTIVGKPLILADTHDVILKNIRVRDSNDDNVRLTGDCRRIVIDHCSLTSAGDGALDITQNYKTQAAPRDVTISWCLIALTEKASLISQVSRLSIHHCLFSNNSQRNPQLHAVKAFDFRNNVVRNWLVYGIRLRYGSSGNIVGNIFLPGVNPRKPADRVLVIQRDVKNSAAAAGPVYLKGNSFPAHTDRTNYTSSAEIPAPPVVLDSTKILWKSLRANVGALPHDTIDSEIINKPGGLRFRPSATKDRH